MASKTSKELIRKLFSGHELPYVSFIPWVFSYASRLEQIALDKMLTDPGLLTRSLYNAQRLFGYDGVTFNFDSKLQAEICGCAITWNESDLISISNCNLDQVREVIKIDITEFAKMGRMPVIIEAAKRLKSMLGRTVAVVGAITGPLSLAEHLTGLSLVKMLSEETGEAKEVLRLAGQIMLRVCRIFCEIQPDIIVISEAKLLELPQNFLSFIMPEFSRVCNLAHFYNAHPVLLVRGDSPEIMEKLFASGFDGIVATCNLDNLADYTKLALRYSTVLGISIPSAILAGPKEALKEYLERILAVEGRIRFLSTEWNVSNDVPPENVHEIINLLRSYNKQALT